MVGVGDIVFDEDIIKQLMKMYPQHSEKKIRSIYNFTFVYIKQQVKVEERTHVPMKGLGTLVLRSEFLRNSIKETEQTSKSLNSRQLERIKLYKRKLEFFDSEYKKRTAGRNYFSPHKVRKILTNWAKTKKLSSKDLQDFQNEGT